MLLMLFFAYNSAPGPFLIFTAITNLESLLENTTGGDQYFVVWQEQGHGPSGAWVCRHIDFRITLHVVWVLDN